MLAQSVVVFISCVIVDSLFQKPCCSLIMILFFGYVFGYLTKHYMVHNLAAYTCKLHWSIVRWIRFKAFLVDGRNNSGIPVFGSGAQVVRLLKYNRQRRNKFLCDKY